MKLLVLGATGGTGLAVVTEALDRGHEVIALVRSPDKLTTQHDKLQIVKGDATSSDDLSAHVTGCDAVLSCLGGRPGVFTPCDIYSKSMEVLADVMKLAGVDRLICITAWGTKDDPNLPFVWRWVLKPTMLKNVVADMSLMEDYLASDKCSHLNYTVLRPPKLVNTPPTGEKVQAVEGLLVPDAHNMICRTDLAKFMLDCLVTKQWDRKMVAVTGPTPVLSEG